MTITLLTSLATLIFIIAIIYLFMFSRMQVAFMQLWSFALIAYCCSVLCLILYNNTGVTEFLQLRKLLDMTNLLLILCSTYALIHTKVPSVWYRFSIYMVFLTVITAIYDIDLLSYYLPVSTYQLFIALFTCYNIVAKWDAAGVIRYVTGIIFLTWGIYKSGVSIYEVFNNSSTILIVMELMFSNLLNISVLILYITNSQEEKVVSSTMFKAIIEKSRDVVFLYQFKPYKTFRYITPSVHTLTGYSRQTFYANPDIFKQIASNDSIGLINEIFDADNNHEDVNIARLRRKNGSEFWAEISRDIIMDTEGVSAMECTIRDVTDVHSAKMEQIKATQSRNMLLSYISHEMRTPVTSIAGFLTAIQDGVMSSEEEKKEALDIITSKTITLKALIDDLDQLTKLETNKFTFNFMLTNAGELVEQLINDNINESESHNYQVEINADIRHLTDFWVIIDYVRINQVFSNLLTNVYKYAADSDKMIWTFELDQSLEHLVISVRDFGYGISSKDLPHVFDKFYRSSQKKDIVQGRGLGLTLCRELINAHHGEMYVDSVEGEGSTFTFIIPLYKED